jgi:DNA uptake protein ComE-like DNA-binding protein
VNPRNRGSVLIITLLVLFFLSAAALSLAYYMRQEMKLVSRHIDRLRSFYIARGALSLLLEEFDRDKLNNQFDYLEDWLQEFQDKGVPFSRQLKDIEGGTAGTYKVVISHESGRININKASAQCLERLLSNFKGIDAGRLAAGITAYKRDKQPDNNFYSVHELLRVKGIKEEVFWGEDTNENGLLDRQEDDGDKSLPVDDRDGELDWGLKDYLTVYTDGRININSASLPVLLSMPGMDEDIAGVITDARVREPFKSLEDLRKLPLISDNVFTQLSGWATVKSDCFRIYIIAEAAQAELSRQILVILDRSVEPVEIRYWRED